MLLCVGAQAQSFNLGTPVSSGRFGATVTVLTNGNYVIADPFWDNGSIADVGAVYLYNGSTHALIATLTGSQANDKVGFDVTALTNGNYVVRSIFWSNGTITDAGAVTWCSGTTGVSGVVSSSNSLVGSQGYDDVGSDGITALPNGAYVVRSTHWHNGSAPYAGAVTWGSGTAGISGVVSSSNSLVGSQWGDQVGGGITVLANGAYVVYSELWDNGITDVGAATWGSATAGVSGVVSSSNSLVGSYHNNAVGRDITVLTNGAYVVSSGGINQAGAVTWGSPTAGVSGTVSSSNSLVGSQYGDAVGVRVTALTNGNYVVTSYYWDNGTIADAGAVTWCSGTTGRTGVVSSSNSLVGSQAYDYVGLGGNVGLGSITALTNGAYVVRSDSWHNGTNAYAGAVTWGSGTAGISGVLSSSNSLVGSQAYDYVGLGGITALTNGAYVVSSYLWDNGFNGDAGAATWGSGTAGVSGVISSSNSLVGSTTNDKVGSGGATALTNGNYVVRSQNWHNGTIADAGAATWCSGTAGLSGAVSNSNSLVGSHSNDQVGLVTALTNGNYVVRCQNWDNGSITDVGAATWGSGTAGVSGAVSSSNSLVGNTTNDRVGDSITVLTNGNYVVRSYLWDNGTIANAGAVTWGSGTAGVSGAVSSTNSLVGSTAGDSVGSPGITPLTNGNYVVRSTIWDNGAVVNAGAITLGKSNGGTIGAITSCNSVPGGITNSITYSRFAYNNTYEYLIAGKYTENIVTIFSPSQSTPANASDSVTDNALGMTTISFVDVSCKLIASVKPSGASPVSGNVTAKVYVESTAPTYNGHAYVMRHYDILPANNPSTVTATVTLYFTQAEFNNYNSNNGTDPDLPTSASDATGIGNLRIRQEHGISASGALGSYSGSTVVIDPADANIVYNSNLGRWEVRFDVNGFSGFFAFGAAGTPLPLNLHSFTAQKVTDHRNRISWATASEIQGSTFEVTRSSDGGLFASLGFVPRKGTASEYAFYDEAPLAPINYYRLRTTGSNGETTYSNIAIVVNGSADKDWISIAPIPASQNVIITNRDAFLNGNTAIITNMQGREVYRLTLTATATIDVSTWPSGIYVLRLPGGQVVRMVKD